MPIKLLSALLLVGAAACAGRAPRAAEPPLLPVKKKWVAPLPVDDQIQGGIESDGSRLFVSTRRTLRALDRDGGATLWARPDVSGVLAAAPGVLIARQEAGTVIAIDPANGKTRWTAATASAGAGAPLVEGARVYLIGSRYTVLDTASGKVVTDAELDSAAVTSPVRSGPCLLTGHADATLRCLDATTGRTIWSFPMSKPLEASPTLDGDRILVGTSDRRALVLKTKGKTDWFFDLGAGFAVSPAGAGRYSLFANSEAVLYAFLRGNGHMSWRAPLPSRPLGAPIVVGRQVLVACLPDQLLAFDVETGKGAGSTRAGIERLGADARPSEIRTPPLVIDRTIYVGIRGPWAVVALEPGAAARPPEPPAPFPVDPADDLAKPSPKP